MTRVTRREFGATTAGALLATAGSARVRGANDRVRLGFIGVGNRGDQVLDAFVVHKDAEIVAVCDIHEPYVNFAAQKAGGQPARHKRLPQAAGEQGGRRGRHQHAGSLVRAADDSGLRSRQGRVR